MSSASESSAIELSNISCSRTNGEARTLESVREISAPFPRRSFNLVTGSSAGERALLLRLLSLLETPDAGDVLLDGQPTRELDDGARAELRSRRLGLIYTSPFLLPSLSTIENIAVPLFKVSGMEPDEARLRAEAALEFVGLGGAEQFRSGDLSRGEQHGVALARALATEPGVLLVEELDSIVSGEALQYFTGLLRQATDRFGVTVICTASPTFAAGAACRILSVEHGTVDAAILREPLA